MMSCIKKEIILNLIQPMTWITTAFFYHFKPPPILFSNYPFILYFLYILFHYSIFFFDSLSTLNFLLFLHLLFDFSLFTFTYLSYFRSQLECLPVKLTLVLVVKVCLCEAILVFALDAIILLVFTLHQRMMMK